METEARPRSRARRFTDLALIALFAVALIAPTVDHFVRDDEARGPGRELRSAASEPEPPRTVADLVAFPRRYEAYWNDSFGLRDKLLEAHSVFKVFGLGVSPDRQHVLGKDRWVFYDGAKTVDSWRGAIPLTTQQLETWRQRIERRGSALAEFGAHYVFALAPDKPGIYPEFMPERFNKLGPSRMDQLYEYLRANSAADTFDFRPALLAEKANDEPGDYVYFRLGTHWEMRGAIAAYNAFVAHLRPRFPTLREFPFSAHQRHPNDSVGDSEAVKMYLGPWLTQSQNYFGLAAPVQHRVLSETPQPSWTRVTELDDPALPRLFILHDSFAPFLDRHFAETSSHAAMVWSYEFDLDQIASHAPDLVIELVVERVLWIHDPARPTAGERRTLSERFASATRVLHVLDPAAPAIKPLRRAQVRASSDEQGPFVELAARRKLSAFELRGFEPQRAARMIARVEVDAEQEGLLTLLWRCQGDVGWVNSRKVDGRLKPGRNVLMIPLRPGEKPLERMLLTMQPRPGALRLRALELRIEAQK